MTHSKNRNLSKLLIYFFLVPSFLYQNIALAGVSGTEVEWEPVGRKYLVPVTEDPDFIRSLMKLNIASDSPPKPFVEKFFTKAGLKNVLEEEGQEAVAEVGDVKALKKDLKWDGVSFIFVDSERKTLFFHAHKTHRNSFALSLNRSFVFDEVQILGRDNTCQQFSRKWLDKRLTSLDLRGTFNSFLERGYRFLRTASVQVKTAGEGDSPLQFYAVFDKRKPGSQETVQSPWLRPHHFVSEQGFGDESYLRSRKKYLSLIHHRRSDVVNYLQDLQKSCSPSSSPQPLVSSSVSSSSSSSNSSSRRGSIIEIDVGSDLMSHVSRVRINEDDTLSFEAIYSINAFLSGVSERYQEPETIEKVDFSDGNPIPEFIIEALIEKWLLTLPNLRTVIFSGNPFTNTMARSTSLFKLVSNPTFELLDLRETRFNRGGLDEFRDAFLTMKSDEIEIPEEDTDEREEEVNDQDVVPLSWKESILRKFKI